MNEAKAREAEAQTRYQRMNDMYQRRVVAKATLDEASAGRDAAVARLVAARAGLESARGRRVVHGDPRAVRRRRHAAARASGRSGGARHAAHERRIARRAARRGGRAPERHRAGGTVRKAAVYVERPAHRGHGRHAVPVGRAAVEHLPRRIELPKDVEGLAPGMFVKVGLVVGEADRLLVPRSAVVERSEMRGVYVVTADGAWR